MISYSQNFEDVILSRALKAVEKGFYIDVGAYHPVEHSVSLAFYERGWRGVHVEASPYYAALLTAARPDEDVLQAAVGAESGDADFFVIAGTGLSTADPQIAALHAGSGFAANTVRVASITLAEIFDRYGDRDVHWLKIDVEGHEAAVIQGWQPSKIRPWILCIEAIDPVGRTEVSDVWEPMITEMGYDPVYFDGINKFYLSRAHPELAHHFRLPPNVFDGFVLGGTAAGTFCGPAALAARPGEEAAGLFNGLRRWLMGGRSKR